MKPDGLRVAADFLLIWCHALWPANNRYLRWSQLSAVCFGGGRHRVGPSPSAETEKHCHLSGDFGRPHLSRELAVLDCGLPRCHQRALGRLRATSSNVRCSPEAALITGTCAAPGGRGGEGHQHLMLPLSSSPGMVLGTLRSCIKPSLCNSPAGSLALEQTLQ